jgi:hypothetical protein
MRLIGEVTPDEVRERVDRGISKGLLEKRLKRKLE